MGMSEEGLDHGFSWMFLDFCRSSAISDVFHRFAQFLKFSKIFQIPMILRFSGISWILVDVGDLEMRLFKTWNDSKKQAAAHVKIFARFWAC